MSISAPLAYTTLPPPVQPRGTAARIFRWLGACAFWIFLGSLLVGGTTYTVGEKVGILVGWMIPVALTLLLVAGAVLAGGARRVRDDSVLFYLDTAIALNSPLVAMVGACERGERGSVRSRLGHLRRRLRAGEPIGMALAHAAPTLPHRIIGLIIAGEQIGRLQDVMRRVAAHRGIRRVSNPTRTIYLRWYPMVLLAFCFTVLEIALIFIMPKFQQVTRSFGIPPTGPLMHMNSLPGDLDLVILYGGLAVVAIFCGRMLSQIFTPTGVTLGPLRRGVEIVFWFVPFIGHAARSSGMADVCYVMAGGIEAGLSSGQAIVAAASASGNYLLELRVRRWARALLSGIDLATAARSARLPALLAGMLATTRTPADTQNVLRFLTRYYDGQFSRTATLMKAAMIPAIAIGFGFLVWLIALGVFEPLVALVNRLTQR